MPALDDRDEGLEQTAPVWAVFGDLMAGLLGAFVLILVGVLVVQMDLVANLESEIRKRQQELLHSLQARSDSAELEQVIELVGLLLEESKRNLVKCDASEFMVVQGEARAMDKLLRRFERPLNTYSEE